MKRFLFPVLAILCALFFAPIALAENTSTEQSYIVVFESDASVSEEVAGLRSDEKVVPRVFRNALRGAQVMLSPDEAVALENNPDVRFVERDGRAHALLSWGLDRIDQRGLPLSGSYTAPATGAGTRAYIVDTGVRADHEEFRGRMLPGWTAIGDGRGTEDCAGHGTHVAGTVAGSTYGVARAAQIVPVRVLSCEGSGSWSGIIAGLDWIVADHDPGEVAVANMSLGGSRMESVNAAVARVVADGVPVAAAAGNENSDACSTSPASAPSAYTVGATTSSDARSSFSNWGSCVDVFAPGSSIVSAWSSSSSASASLSGTSMASPHVAGALLLGIDVLGRASSGVVSGLPSGTPNKLLYVGGDEDTTPPPLGPPNDNFADALAGEEVSFGSSEGATREVGEPRHVYSNSDSEKSVWYFWTAPSDGEVAWSTSGSSFDTLLAVYRGSTLGSLQLVAANDDASSGFASRVAFSASAGTTYRIAIDGYNNASGSIRLERTWEPTSPSDPPSDPPPPDEPGRVARITSAPPSPSSSRSARFVFEGSECSLDGGAWESCASSKTYVSLAEGQHHFRVRRGTSVAEHVWAIDVTPPPTLAVSRDGEELFWTGEEGSTFFCAVDRQEPARCTSPFRLPAESPGTFIVRVWQRDAAGNASEPAMITWTVQDTALRILLGPPRKSTSRRATFRVSGIATECRIDRGAWAACGGPQRYSGLRLGRHLFEVRDSSGAKQSYRWKIVPKKK